MTASTTQFCHHPVPMSSPDLTNSEREAVMAVLHTPNLSMGKEILAFEQAICDYTGAKHALGVNSGTAGLHLCARAAGIRDGDWVLTTPFSFVASTNVILFERAIPIFVDVDPRTGNIDPECVRQAVSELFAGGEAARQWLPRTGLERRDTPRLKAILPVDVFGQPADMEPILEVARNFDLKVIEDSCEAIGAKYKGRPAGRLGHYGVFAFYPNKQMTVGEGGVVVTDDDEAARIMRALRNQGRAPGDTWLQHTYLGYNYRLDEMSAALGRVQVARLDEMLNKRELVARWYEERLAEIPGVEIPVVLQETTRMSWFVYVVRFSPGIDRDKVSGELKKRAIPNRPYFLPIHLQPYMTEKFGYREGDYPVTEDLGRRGLALPFSGVMSEKDVKRVCEAIREVLM
ncbi:MAG TPA: DegT/DnrJ/EryC1/StrS family aminotransferase [Anaerolineales bacterium]|nr:DegT/DnrJ/EryC1/StrS family aminotransferase [Anaerolineales bacterium]